MFVRTRIVPLVIAIALALSWIPANSALASDSLVVRGSATATSTVGTSIVTGDTFTFEITFDLSSSSTSSIASSARRFNNAVDAFSFEASDDNSGTWSPDGIAWSISPVDNLPLNENADQLTLQIQGSGAPQINGVNFFDVVITVDWDASDVDVQLSGVSQTLANALGTSTPDFSVAQYFFELRDTNFSSANFAAQYQAPEPTVSPDTNSSSESASIPGIYLHVAAVPGRPVEGTPVYHGSFAIASNSTYALSVQSRDTRALPRTVLSTGVTNGRGHVEQRIELGALAPGAYKIVMNGYHELGYPLVLTNHINVDAAGNFVSVSAESLQPTLR